jgi:hypothetical protein
MIDIVNRLRFDATRCELQFSKGVAGNIDAGADEIEVLRQRILDAELALNVWDKGHDSEYWLRHPTPISRI